MRKFITAFLVLYFNCTLSYAELQWTSTGPGGGGAFASTSIGPKGDVIIGSDLSGAYRSIDGGKTWTIIGPNNGMYSTHIDSIAHNRNVDGTVFLASENGVYRSVDCYASTSAQCSFSRKAEGLITAVAVAHWGDAANTLVYAAGLPRYCQPPSLIWRSFDNGETWGQAGGNGLPNSVNIMAIRVAPNASGTIIVISTPERFSGPKECGVERWPTPAPKRAFLSTDGGANFIELAPGVGEVEDAKFDVLDANRIWLTVTGDVWDNAGSLWLSDGSAGIGQAFSLQSNEHSGQIWPLRNGNVRLLDLKRQQIWQNRPNREFDRTGIWEFNSLDKTFTHVTSKEDFDAWDLGWNGQVHAPLASLNGNMQSFAYANDNEAWWVDQQFAFKSDDGGRKFNQQFTDRQQDGSFISRKIDNAVPGVLAPSPVDANLLYTGYFDMGCWKSSNALGPKDSVSWADCNGPKSKFDFDTKNMPPSPLNGWWLGYGGNTTAIVPDPTNAAKVWAVHSRSNYKHGEAPGGLYRIASSIDNYKTWIDHTGNLTDLSKAAAITALAVTAPKSGKRGLWALAGHQLFNRVEGSERWRKQATACDGGAVIMAGNGATLLIGGGSGVCVSHDYGKSWRKASGVPTFKYVPKTWWGSFGDAPHGTSDFAIDPSNPKRIYMTMMMPDYTQDSADAGLYRSLDGGSAWEKMESFPNGPFERNFLRSVAVNPGNSQMIVVGSSPASVAGGYFDGLKRSGAWVSRDGGRSWNLENTGLAWPFINRLRFVSPTRLYGISSGQGVVFSDMK